MGSAPLTAAEVVRVGGWNAEFAVVPTVATDGDVAVALVASNGLGFEVEVEVLRRVDGDWRSSFSMGAGDLDHGCTSGAEPGCVFVVGRAAEPAHSVVVQYGEETVEVVAGVDGYWSWVRAVDDPWSGGEPRVVPGERPGSGTS